jgi:hypothetical protein
LIPDGGFKLKKFFAVSTFCSALLFFGFAVPSNAEVVLDFSNTNGSGSSDISTTPGTDGANTVVSLSIIFNSLAVSGAPSDDGTTSVFLNEYYCTDTTTCNSLGVSGILPNIIYVVGTALGVTGDITGPNTPPLVEIALSGALTGTVAASPTFSLTFPTDVSTVTVSPGLLSALGDSGAVPSLTGMTNVETGGGGGSYSVTSQATLDLGSPAPPAPEPSTWLMMTLGMFLIVFVARKKSSRLS